MPAIAPIQDLKKAQDSINDLKKKYPSACNDFMQFLSAYRGVGYSNLCKMFIEEATPESLKYGQPRFGYYA